MDLARSPPVSGSGRREASMQRTITYRGFEIHVELTTAAEETFDVTFQIKGGTNLEVLGAREAA